METEYGELRIGINALYGEELLVETTADTSERGGAERVLSVEAEAKATGVELLDKEAEVSGKVNYRLLYLDKQRRLCGLDYFKDFKCRVAGDEITPTGKSAVTFSVPDAGARVEGDKVELSAFLEVSLRYFGESEMQKVTAIEGAECRKREFLSQQAKRIERTIELEKVADVGSEVKKILLFDTALTITDIARKEDGSEVSGAVRADILYLNEADETVELTAELPFSEVFEDAPLAEYSAAIKSSRIVLTDDEGGNAIEIEAAVTIGEISYEESVEEVTVAACGEKNAVEEIFAKAKGRRFFAQETFAESLTGGIPLPVENVYHVIARPGCRAIADVAVTDGSVRVEGVSAFRLLYLTEEGYASAQGELPFAFALPLKVAREGLKAEATLGITEPKASYNGKEWVVTAKADLSISLFEEEEVSYLADAKEGDPIPESEAGVSVYFAEKGEDVWQIAKTMGVLPSDLVKANPFLAEPLTENRKILVFYRK